MAELKFFTLVGRERSVVADEPSDPDEDPQVKGIHAGVTITPATAGHPVLKAATLVPDPSLIVLYPIEARLDDGRLKLRADEQYNIIDEVATYANLPGGLVMADAGKAWVVEADKLVYIWSGTAFPADGAGEETLDQPDIRLAAKCSVLDIGDKALIYTVRPHHVTANGKAQDLPAFSFEAPTIPDDHDDEIDGEIVVDWATVEWLEGGAPVAGGIIIRHVPDEVSRVGDTLVFSVAGTDLPNPLDISDLVFDGTFDGIADATTVGKAVGRAASQAAARTAIDAERAVRFNVKNFGAVGDGTTDDTAAIQDAIDTAVAAGGAQVYLPIGEYKLTNTITLGDGADLAGAGSGSVLKPVFSASPPNRVIDNDWVSGNSNISLRNFRLDRSGANVSHGILLNGVDGLLVDGIESVGDPGFTGTPSGVLAISSIGPNPRIVSKNIRVVNCVFRDVHNFGVQVAYVDGCVIANNTAYNASREVFAAEPEPGTTAKNVTISGNTVLGSADVDGTNTGLIIVAETSGGTVIGASVTGNSIRQASGATDANPGIYIHGGTAVTVTGNSVHDMGGVGINVGQNTTATTGVVIQGNTVYNCGLVGGASGILLRKADHCTILGNYVYGAGHTYGIEESSGTATDNNLIAFNFLRDTNPISTIGAGTVVFGNKTADADNTITNGSAAASLSIIKLDATSTRRVDFKKGGVSRWFQDVTGTESGSSTGSDMLFTARDDAGSSLGTALTLKRVGRQMVIGGSVALNRRPVATDYTIVSTDNLIAVTSTAAPRTITLPAVSATLAGTEFIVKDESGGAATNNITIARAGSDTIDGATSVVISTNYAAVRLYCTGAGWTHDPAYLKPGTGIPKSDLATAVQTTLDKADSAVQRDANSNLQADAFIPGSTSTLTAAGTTTLTVDSTEVQTFTGSSNQSLVLPTTGIVAGHRYMVINPSTGTITVKSSDTTAIANLQPGQSAIVVANTATPTAGAHWTVCFLAGNAIRATASASGVALRDAQANLVADAFIPGLATTATAAGTTTLTVDSVETQVFTGATTQNVTLPTTTVAGGQRYTIINTSSGAVTVNSSGGNLVKTVAAGASSVITALQAAPTAAAHWYAT